MNPVSNTAYYCCGVRMQDARRERSVCHDSYAERFMDHRGQAIFEPFQTEKMPNISNIMRCRLIDDFVTAEISQDKNQLIISIGAGFDSRPYRISGGQWVEIDEAAILDIKNDRLPVDECKNPISRVAIDFSSESLSDKLSGLATDAHTVFVIEGVFMYLHPESISQTLTVLQTLFPNHVLYCDLMTKRFFEKFAQRVHSKLVAAGGTFTERPERPAAQFLQHHYQQTAQIPTFKKAGEMGLLWREAKIPGFIVSLLLNLLVKDLAGYAVHQFRYQAPE